MKLSDIGKRLAAPFEAHHVDWKPGALTKDRKRAMMMAYIDARCVMDRLDAVVPDEWTFEITVIEGARIPTVKGRLTVLGVSREDIGEAQEGDLGTIKAAASDALKRCAVQFGIGRYLYDLPKQWVEWDEQKRKPASVPRLPEWARPDHERSSGGAHIGQAMEQLKYEMPEDLDLQREVYKHLKAALSSLHLPLPHDPPASPQPRQAAAAASPTRDSHQAASGPSRPAQGQEVQGKAEALAVEPITNAQKGVLHGHAQRAGANSSYQRSWLWALLTGSTEQRPTINLTKDEAANICQMCGGWSNEELAAKLQEALALIPDEDLPF